MAEGAEQASIMVKFTVGIPQDPIPLFVTIYGGQADGWFVEPKTKYDLKPLHQSIWDVLRHIHDPDPTICPKCARFGDAWREVADRVEQLPALFGEALAEVHSDRE